MCVQLERWSKACMVFRSLRINFQKQKKNSEREREKLIISYLFAYSIRQEVGM